MSQLNIKQAFLSHLLANLPSGINATDVAFENKAFDPSNKSAWLSAYFIPATSAMMGKSINDRNEERGIYQVSVFVPLEDPNYDNEQLRIIDELKGAFKYNQEIVYNNTTVSILNSDITSGDENAAWFKRDLSINYLTFTSRG